MDDLFRMLRYAQKHWYLIAFSLILTLTNSFFTAYIPLISTRDIIDQVLLQHHYDLLGFYLLLIIGMYVVTSVIDFAQRYVSSYVSQRVVFDIRNELFESLQRKSFSFYDQTQTGQLISRTTSDVNRINRFYAFWIRSLFGSVIQIIFIAYYLIGLDLRLTTISLVIIPPIVALNYLYMRKIHPIFVHARHQFGTINSLLQQNIVGVKVVRVFTNETYEQNKFTAANDKYFSINVEAAKQRAFYQPLITFILSLGVTGGYWYGGGEAIRGTITLGSLLLFNQYITMLTRPVRFLGFLIGMYSRALAAGKRVFNIIASQSEITDEPDALALPPIQGDVLFDHVSFGYDPSKPVLKDLTFCVKAGETIAILGATGSGKSTLIHLIPRFYEITQGRITIDGYDIGNVKLQSLRRTVGIVLQDVFLFSTTIKENIAFGKPGATMDEVITAAKRAQAHDFITALPEGYYTVVGERGTTLSGGQKQRIAISRTLLMNPRILIFDDSTSFVDTKTERAIQKALDTLLDNRTAFVITQRLSTIKKADRILVLENGKIAELGTHEDLLALHGIYSRIYKTQFAPKEAIQRSKAEND